MRSTWISWFTFASLLSVALAAPARRLQIKQATGEKHEGSYIVKVKDGVNKKLTLAWLDAHLGTESKVVHKYDSLPKLNLFAGTFSNRTLEALLTHKDIEYVTEDAIFSISKDDIVHEGVGARGVQYSRTPD